MVHWNARRLLADDIEMLHEAGYLICIYTVDDDISLFGAAHLGIDMITTNEPAHLALLVAKGTVKRGRSKR